MIKTYSWTRVWGIMDDPGTLSIGDDVVVVNADGEVTKQVVTTIVPHVTKNGKLKDFAHVVESS